ncbi:simple sugar transport system ATP-binding protein [Devosia crocina]|uniref:Simple sugar transport system ATP-binding protein n=1 Tax=Devosia crocina TaxID=429728 RepID=A0A1I7NPS1_9HYPH|nr:ABC transporter ATP-binding protein [Devosia crocina]SFV36623.1 simple sugar transport system ATP-binding protein [Devosia crocina]
MNTQRSDTTVAAAPAAGWAIELEKINKRFGAVHANKDIDLRVQRGTIHGIVGENGAGKSTLMSILYGFYTADSGTIRVNGQVQEIADSRHALALGIGMVHQHFMLVDNFSVLENVVLGAEDSGFLKPSLTRARKELNRLEQEYDLEVDPDAIIEDVSVGQQQRVEILKALYRGAETLILDEPTGVLTPKEADDLFRVLETLRDQGKTVILITHKLREIMAITDNVSVMRQGQMVATVKTAETSPEQLAELMVGRRVLLRVDKSAANPGKTLLEVQNLVVADDMGITRVKDVSFAIRAGEIVGIAGVSGNGQTELLESITGMRDQKSGTVVLNGKPLALEGDDGAARARKAGLAHVPEDRQRMGLVTTFAEWENAILGYHDKPAYGSGPFLDIAAAKKAAADHVKLFDVRPANINLKSSLFSGGNQQKIVLAREMEQDPDVLVIGQPTRGVDIGAIEFIHNEIIKMRDEGKAILLVSVELDEIRSLADRILVMFDGVIVGEADPATATEGELGLMMAGINKETAPRGLGIAEQGPLP